MVLVNQDLSSTAVARAGAATLRNGAAPVAALAQAPAPEQTLAGVGRCEAGEVETQVAPARLSAVVIAQNEEARVAECLRSVQGLADELVVVDGCSVDRTVEICLRHGARVFRREFDGFARQMNFGIQHANGAWVLLIDADERLTPEAAEQIREAIAAPGQAGYFLPRRNIVFGHWLRHGGNYPDYNVPRLFRRERGRFDETPVHSKLLLKGATGHLSAPLLHLSYPDLSAYFHKFDRYTTLESEGMRQRGIRFSVCRMLSLAIGRLTKRVVLQGAFLDGAAGLEYAFLGFVYEIVRHLKLRELERRSIAAAETCETPGRRWGNVSWRKAFWRPRSSAAVWKEGQAARPATHEGGADADCD